MGLGIEFVVAQWKKEEIQEGFLVSGILIPMIVPVDCPLWILAVATAFSVIFAKSIRRYGYERLQRCPDYACIPVLRLSNKMSGDAVWVSGDSIFGLGQTVDGLTVATPLGAGRYAGASAFNMDMVTGLIPGSIGETSVIAIALGAVILLWTGIASWKTMLRICGRCIHGWVFNTIGRKTPQWLKCRGTNISWWAVSASVPYSWLPTPVTLPVQKPVSTSSDSYRRNGYHYPRAEPRLSEGI